MTDSLQQIFDQPLHSMAVIGNLIIIESLLSVDNAAVLASMVMDLPEQQRKKALKYGILGAYLFRGLALLFAALLVKIWWLKFLGGLYLLYLVYNWLYTKRNNRKNEAHFPEKKNSKLYTLIVGKIGVFWSTIALVEFMDVAFSIDNVFAAVAFSDNILLIWTGVFIGILAMRFVAQGFVDLMKHYPFLETSAFIVIGILGIKLSLSIVEKLEGAEWLAQKIESPTTDLLVSITTMLVFFIPVLTSHFFNVPKHTRK